MIEFNTIYNVPKINSESEININPLPSLMVFGAEWSALSHILTQNIIELAFPYKDKLKVLSIDVDKNSEIKEKYGIREVPTLLFVKKEEIVDYLVGAVPKQVIEDKLIEFIR